MMLVRHELLAQIKCPNDNDTVNYLISVELDKLVMCEDILKLVDELVKEPHFQEDFTIKLSDRLKAKVTTIGEHCHKKVKTECCVQPERDY